MRASRSLAPVVEWGPSNGTESIIAPCSVQLTKRNTIAASDKISLEYFKNVKIQQKRNKKILSIVKRFKRVEPPY